MSNIEPTEDQKQAAEQCWWNDTKPGEDGWEKFARLLAEREAKLRDERDVNIRLRVAAEDRTRMLQGLANTASTERDTLRFRLTEWRGLVTTLRARVAELEASRDEWRDNAGVALEAWERASVREAQHLADIKALRRQLDLSDDVVREYAAGFSELTFDNMTLLDMTAHYDDAKADASASDADIEARVLAGAFARRRNANTEGGEG